MHRVVGFNKTLELASTDVGLSPVSFIEAGLFSQKASLFRLSRELNRLNGTQIASVVQNGASTSL